MTPSRVLLGVVVVLASACGRSEPVSAETPASEEAPSHAAAPSGAPTPPRRQTPPRAKAPPHAKAPPSSAAPPNPNGPPPNAAHESAHTDAPLPQPDPGPAPDAPEPITEGCPDGMVKVAGEAAPFCIHAYELSAQLVDGLIGNPRDHLSDPEKVRLISAPGQYPIQSTFNEARALCASRGFRLCTSAEWRDACDGQPGEGGVPYGSLRGATYEPGDCNFTHHMAGGSVPLARTGSYPWCRTPSGVYDMLGNIWEWSDPGQTHADGRPITDKRGGAHYARRLSSCSQTAVDTHAADWMGSVGFRCCTDVAD